MVGGDCGTTQSLIQTPPSTVSTVTSMPASFRLSTITGRAAASAGKPTMLRIFIGTRPV